MGNSSTQQLGVKVGEFPARGVAMYLLSFLMLGAVSLSLDASQEEALTGRLMTAEEAFDPSHTSGGPPADWIKKVVLDASYEEVFRAASIAATQAQWEIEKQDKHAGIVLAKRLVEGEAVPISWGTEQSTHAHFYRITVTELAAKQTEIAIVAKVQAHCSLQKHRLLGPSRDKIEKDNEYCRKLAAGMWRSVAGSAEVSQFMVFLRNNLLAAGAQ
jgi:hypothetical protein